MTNEQISVVVLRDSAGGYYLLPQEWLDQVHVPAERTSEVDGLLADADTSGYSFAESANTGLKTISLVVGAFGDLVGTAAGSYVAPTKGPYAPPIRHFGVH